MQGRPPTPTQSRPWEDRPPAPRRTTVARADRPTAGFQHVRSIEEMGLNLLRRQPTPPTNARLPPSPAAEAPKGAAAARWAGQNVAHDLLRSCGRLARERTHARRQRRRRHQHGDAVPGPPGAWPHFEGSAEPTGLSAGVGQARSKLQARVRHTLLQLCPTRTQ
jgi:hypothetical protein